MDLKELNRLIGLRPGDLELHQARYRLLTDDGNQAELEAAMHDSSLKLGHPFFIEQFAEMLENRGAYSTAAYWRKELLKLENTPVRVAQLENCEKNEVISLAQAKITFILDHKPVSRTNLLQQQITALKDAIDNGKTSDISEALDLLDLAFEDLLRTED